MVRTPLEIYLQDAHPLIVERARELRREQPGMRLTQAFHTALHEITLTATEAEGRAAWKCLTAREAMRLCAGAVPNPIGGHA